MGLGAGTTCTGGRLSRDRFTRRFGFVERGWPTTGVFRISVQSCARGWPRYDASHQQEGCLMPAPSARLEIQPIKIRQLLEDYRAGRLVVPEFQRQYLRRPNRAPHLLMSMCQAHAPAFEAAPKWSVGCLYR